MNRTYIIAIAVLLPVIATSGCMEPVDTGIGVDRDVYLSPTPTDESGEFQYNGTINITEIGDGCVRDVRVVLYDANTEVIDSKVVGDLCVGNESPSSRPISFQTETQPAYIVIRSPSFWQDQAPARGMGYARDPESELYDEYPVTNESQIKPRGSAAETAANTSIRPSQHY